MEDVVCITIVFCTMLLDSGEKKVIIMMLHWQYSNLQQIHQHQFHNLPLLKEHNDLPSRSSWKQNIK